VSAVWRRRLAVPARISSWVGRPRTKRPVKRHRQQHRFLILPWVRVAGLASHVLGLVSRRIAADWQEKYGHRLEWLETFVETGRFAGTCYRAANWRAVGSTQGRGRQDRRIKHAVPAKQVFLYPLPPMNPLQQTERDVLQQSQAWARTQTGGTTAKAGRSSGHGQSPNRGAIV